MSEYNYDAAIEAATEGRSLKEIALSMGCSYAQLCQATSKNAVFAKALEHARQLGWYLQADRLRTIVDDNPDEDIQRLRLQSDNIKWLLARVMRHVFGDNIEITTVHTDVRAALEEAKNRVKRSITVQAIEHEVNPFD